MRRLVVVVAVGLVAGIAGCGGDDNGGGSDETSGTTNPPAQTGGAAQTVNVTETDFKLDPANPTVDAGTVTFKVSNKGGVEHSLEVEGPNGESELEKSLQPGESGTLKVDLSKKGKYEWYCPIGNHKELGMKGDVTVSGGGTTSQSDGAASGSEDSGGSSGSGGNSDSGSSSGSGGSPY